MNRNVPLALLLALLAVGSAEASIQAPSLVLSDELVFQVDAAEPILGVNVSFNDEPVEAVYDAGRGLVVVETPAPGFHVWKVDMDVNGTTESASGLVQTAPLRVLQQALAAIEALAGQPDPATLANATQARKAAQDALEAIEALELPTDYATTGDVEGVQNALEAKSNDTDAIMSEINDVSRTLWGPAAVLLVVAAALVGLGYYALKQAREAQTRLDAQSVVLFALAEKVGVEIADVELARAMLHATPVLPDKVADVTEVEGPEDGTAA